MQDHQFKFRTETHVVASRMGMYEQRGKWQSRIDEMVHAGRGSSLPAKALANGIKPRALVVEIIYPELDRSQPDADDNAFELPGVTIREISVNDGRISKEFTLSIEEARKLVNLLSGL